MKAEGKRQKADAAAVRAMLIHCALVAGVLVLLVVLVVMAITACSWTDLPGGGKHRTIGQRTTLTFYDPTTGTSCTLTCDSDHAIDVGSRDAGKAPQWVIDQFKDRAMKREED